MPSIPRIKQIQASWKGRIDILNSLKEKSTLLEDRKSAIFFKVFDAIIELEDPPLIKDSKFISTDELEFRFCKLKEKWAGEFDNLSDFSKDNICTWTIEYVNFNNNV